MPKSTIDKNSQIENSQTEKTVSGRSRFHENYFGMAAQTFTCPNEFELAENSLRFSFDSWISVESFERGDAPVERLKKEFLIKDEFQNIKNDNQFFADLINVALVVCSVGGRGYKLRRLFLTTVGKFLTIEVSSPDGADCPTANKYLGEYDQIIAANLELISQIVSFMVVYGKTHDDFLAQADLINE